jgi:hypothetical protein
MLKKSSLKLSIKGNPCLLIALFLLKAGAAFMSRNEAALNKPAPETFFEGLN